MAVTLPSVYQDGTATIAANGTVVTGQSTLWTKALLPGDFFGVHKGYAIRILSVDSDTQLTLANSWPGGAQATAAYEIMLQSDNARMQETSRQLLQQLSNGNLTAFSNLSGAANKVPYFSGPGALSLMDVTSPGQALLGAATVAAQRTALGLGAAAIAGTGTSGHALGFLDGVNTWSGFQAFGAGISIDGATSTNRILSFRTSGSPRWVVRATSTAEGGGNTGSTLTIDRYDDSGAAIDSPLSIARANGIITVANGIGFQGTAAATTRSNLGLGTAATQNTGTSGAAVPLLSGANTWSNSQAIATGGTALISLDSPAGSVSAIQGRKSGATRWNLYVSDGTAESGGNAGSNFAIQRFDDSGASLGTVFSINRASGLAALNNGLTVSGSPLTIGSSSAIAFAGSSASTTLTNLGVSAFMKTLLPAADAVAARATLKITWETIINQAVSAVSAVDLTNLGAYELIKISGALDVSTNASIAAVFSTDNGASFGGTYGEMYTLAAGTTLVTQYFASAPGANITPTADAGAGNGGAFEMIIFNFNKANRAKFTCRSQIIQSGQFLYAEYNGYQPTTAARNALRILCNAGTMSGSIKVEGVRG